MGLIRATIGSAAGVLAEQWKEYFYCEALPENVLAVKGRKKGGGGDNIISNGSVIAVAHGQCMMIVEQGKVVDLCAEPGEYTYDISTEPSIFAGGDLAENLMEVFANIGRRFTFGGVAPKDQRIYYFNTKEILSNKYGTPAPVPFRVVDRNIGLDMDIGIRCYGEYSYRITNPLLFYTNVCGNVEAPYLRSALDSQLRSELLTALQPAFARVSEMGVRYSALPGHTMEMAQALNEVLSSSWRDKRGIELVALGVNSVKADEEDEKLIKEFQRTAMLRDPDMRDAYLAAAGAAAVQTAAANESVGPAMAFMHMNMTAGAGNLSFGQNGKPAGTTAAAGGWTCPGCGSRNTGKFCSECGARRPGQLRYRCSRCGWEPADPTRPPRFCPECGDPFDSGDAVNG